MEQHHGPVVSTLLLWWLKALHLHVCLWLQVAAVLEDDLTIRLAQRPPLSSCFIF